MLNLVPGVIHVMFWWSKHLHITDLEFLFGLDVLDGCVKDLWTVLIGNQVLLQVVLSRSYKHHPVTALLIGKVKPHVTGFVSIFLCIQQTQLQRKIRTKCKAKTIQNKSSTWSNHADCKNELFIIKFIFENAVETNHLKRKKHFI